MDKAYNKKKGCSIEEGQIQKTRQMSSLLVAGKTDIIKFLSALAALHWHDLKNRMNCTGKI